uniref:Uncharacterized protein n=1 Tax=Anopheles darlingi TaxID=43151 RepID=A0A2M4DAH3_ANODA
MTVIGFGWLWSTITSLSPICTTAGNPLSCFDGFLAASRSRSSSSSVGSLVEGLLAGAWVVVGLLDGAQVDPSAISFTLNHSSDSDIAPLVEDSFDSTRFSADVATPCHWGTPDSLLADDVTSFVSPRPSVVSVWRTIFVPFSPSSSGTCTSRCSRLTSSSLCGNATDGSGVCGGRLSVSRISSALVISLILIPSGLSCEGVGNIVVVVVAAAVLVVAVVVVADALAAGVVDGVCF